MKKRFFAMASLALMALAGCSKGADDPAGMADGWHIPAGTYRYAPPSDDGFEVYLSEGDKSPVAAVAFCNPACGEPQHAAVMRGLNGISFTLKRASQNVDVTLTPASTNEILLSGDWGEGLSSVTLRHVDGPNRREQANGANAERL